jgi:hypothetical protein
MGKPVGNQSTPFGSRTNVARIGEQSERSPLSGSGGRVYDYVKQKAAAKIG